MKTNEFLVNRDETGREIVFYPETGKKYFVEYITPKHTIKWGDLNPATGKIEGSYGDKKTGSISKEESLITEENGFNRIETGMGSPYHTIHLMHEEWKRDNIKKI